MPLSIDWNIISPQDLLNKLRFIVSYNDEFKALPRKQRAIYTAIRGELIECLQEESDNVIEQCQTYLRIIELSYDLEDWQLAKNLILSNANEKQTISEQISILGFYEDKCKIYTNLIGKIDLYFDCFLWGEIGSAFNTLGNADNAFQYHKKQLIISQEIYRFNETLSAYNGLANIYSYSRKNIQKVLNYAQNCLSIIKKYEIQDYKQNIYTLMHLGWAYSELSKFKKAILFMKEALALAEKNQDPYMISECLTQLGIIYELMQDFNQAVVVLSQQVKILKNLKYRKLEATCLCNLSLCEAELYGLKNKKSSQECINYLLDALEISKKIKDKILQNICYSHLSTIFLRKKEYQVGLQYLQEIKIGYLGDSFDCGVLSNFCYVYGCQRNFSYSIEYAERAISISSKIQNKGKRDQISFQIYSVVANAHWYQGRYLQGIAHIIKAFCLFSPWKSLDSKFVFQTLCREIKELLKSKLDSLVLVNFLQKKHRQCKTD